MATVFFSGIAILGRMSLLCASYLCVAPHDLIFLFMNKVSGHSSVLEISASR